MQQGGSLELSGPDETVRIMSVSCSSEDHKALREILGRQWKIEAESTAVPALDCLRRNPFALIVCEREIAPGSWKDLLSTIVSLHPAPMFILTSLHADDRLWSEALNLGAYDLLRKPFDRVEVKRTLSMAWLHWKHQRRSGSGRARSASG